MYGVLGFVKRTSNTHNFVWRVCNVRVQFSALSIYKFGLSICLGVCLFAWSTIICYQLTCYQPHLLSPYLLSIHLLSIHLLSASLALRPHLLSPHLLSSLTCYQVNLLSGLTCYQNVCSPVSTAINAHLLSKTSYYPNTLLSKLVVFLNKLLSKPVLSCYYKLVAF